MRTLNVVLAVLVSLLIGFSVFEGGLRLTSFAPVETGNRFDPALGWAKQPGAVVSSRGAEFNVELAFNEYGLRDDPMADPAKPDDVFRIVCLGDSFTLGYTVAREDLFVDLLEGWWQAEGRRIEIINAGVEGYSTDQAARWLALHGETFAPDLVLHFPYQNDIFWNGQKQYLRYPKPRYMPTGRPEARKLDEPAARPWTQEWATTIALGRLAGLLRGGKQGPEWFVPEGGDEPILREFAPLLVDPPAFLTDDPENPLGRTRGALQAMRDAATNLGAELLVVPIPDQMDVDPDQAVRFGDETLRLHRTLWDPARPVDLFLGEAQGLGIETLDVRSTFKALIAEGRKLYYRADWHLNPSGNRAFARFLYNELDSTQNDLLPPEFAAETKLSAPPSTPGDFPPFWLVLYGTLVFVLTSMYKLTYRSEALTAVLPRVAGMLALVFLVFLGGRALVVALPPDLGGVVLFLAFFGLFGFILFKLGRRVGTITELTLAFVKRGHWYLLPLLVVLLSIGSLLVVAASSPLVAPFIYTLF